MNPARHIFCLTVDTDPDGANAPGGGDRELTWDSLEAARSLPERLDDSLGATLGCLPITWFARIDAQIESVHGTPFYLFERFAGFWQAAEARGDEIGWHPHLHGRGPNAGLLRDPQAACDELARLREAISGSRPLPCSFRNGEGWHLPETLAQVEAFGIGCDSSAIPGRDGGPGHPRNWVGAPNHPYFPDPSDIRRAGPQRPLLEVPMTTWQVEAPYDAGPRTRYMNPAIHPGIFSLALEGWARELLRMNEGLWVWVLILHPDEAFPAAGADALYARRPEAVAANLANLAGAVSRAGQRIEFATISRAASCWRGSLEAEP